MFKHYKKYYWKDGKPYGSEEVDPSEAISSYKIIVDPYYKRFSLEKYHYVTFQKVIYDSLLLDYRHLTLKDQVAWQREVIKEENDQAVTLIRNHEDRVIFIETLFFEQNQCRICQISSAHGISLSIHKMYYESFQDVFNGVVLYDTENQPVMMKIYEVDPLTGEFTNILKEEWNMKTTPSVLQ